MHPWTTLGDVEAAIAGHVTAALDESEDWSGLNYWYQFIHIYIDYMINQIMKTQTQFIDHWSITSTVYTQVYVVGLYCLYTLYVYQLALTQEPDSNSSEESMSTVKKVWMDWWGLCFIWDRKNPDMKREMFCVSIYIIYMQCVGSLTLTWTNNIYMYIYIIFFMYKKF